MNGAFASAGHPAGQAAAALPILLIVVLMLGLRWPASRAGVAGLALTLALANWLFGYGDTVYGDLGYVRAVGGAAAEAAFTAATILWIIFPALCIYHLQVATGLVDVIRRSIAGVSGDPRLGLVLLAWFFALFMEGAAGFGSPVALAAPLLVGAGVPPLHAVTAALVGHAVGVSFGAVGTPIAVQAAISGFSPAELGRATATYHALFGWTMALIAVGTAASGQGGGRAGRPLWMWSVAAAALFLAPLFAVARWVGPELPTLAGALAGGLTFALLLKLTHRRAAAKDDVPRGRLAIAAAPYLALIALVLLTRLLDPVRAAAMSASVEWRVFGVFSGQVQPFYHPGTMLLAGFLVGAVVQRAGAAEVRTAMGRAGRQLGPVIVALVAMLGMSRLMVHSGMVETLAASGAALGGLWPFVSPFVGVLGTFVTGSATASNILMTDLQSATAATLELRQLPLLGAQSFGAAVGNIVAPHNIIAGCATVNLSGREGDVLRRTVWACLLYASLGGLLAMAIAGSGRP